jgi:DNA polymerase-3 subunit alpha
MNFLTGIRTSFSMTESILSPKTVIDQAKALGYDTVAVTDTNTVNAIPALTVEGRAKDVRVIGGMSIRVVDDLAWRKPKKNEARTKNAFFYASVYAINKSGFTDMMKLLTLANSEDNFYFLPQIDFTQLLAAYQAGNIAISTGTLYSMLSHTNAHNHIKTLASVSVERLFIDLVAVNTAFFKRCNEVGLELADAFNLKTLPAIPALHEPGNKDVRDTMEVVFNPRDTIDTPWLNKVPEGYHLVDSAGVLSILGNQQRLEEGVKVFTDLCQYQWEKYDICLPNMAEDPFATLMQLCKEGWRKRIDRPVLGYTPEPAKLKQYKTRLVYELAVLRKMGFCDYFLLVHEAVDWCKAADITVGPGRGSVGGSLIAYLIGITDVDPLRFGLIFERFINPDRLDLPDIDLDFMSSRRHEVIEHLIDVYGEDRVAGISNYASLGPASALRGAAKAHGLFESEYRCSKLIPDEHGQSIPLQDCVEQVPELEAFAKKYPIVWEKAVSLQGVMRNLAQHAAGVIVAGEPIVERAAMERRKGGLVVNWDKRLVEDFGLIKLDILGLSTLDVLALIKQYVLKRHGKAIELTDIALGDARVLERFSAGDSAGVFQFESGGMRNLLKQLATEGTLTFEDVIAATALYRPGPMEAGLMDDYIAIKQGNQLPHYLHPSMKPALEETNSVIVYQEQVMQVARDLAGFTMAESDKLRSAMGKKDAEKMKTMREQWIDGCANTSDLHPEVAANLFNQIEEFAGYAFNKSHSVEYSIISYWCMWFKTYYPAEFFAAALTIADEDRRKSLLKDCTKKGIEVAPPDINFSTDRFEIGEGPDGAILLFAPFQAITGLSEKSSAAILEAKAKHVIPFTSKEEFLAVVNKRSCNIRQQAALDSVGAFASIEPSQLQARHPDRVKDQKLLLRGLVSATVKADRNIDVSPYVKSELVKMISQCRECTGCSLQGLPHPAPRLGQRPKIMIVTDAVNWTEEKAGKIGEGECAEPMKEALRGAGLTMKDIYFTAMIKSKVKSGDITNDMINNCTPYLAREIELLKPAVIIAMGSRSARHLCPDLKGGWEEILGQDVYDPKLDATILIGLNPMMVVMDSDKQTLMNEVMVAAAEVIS